MKFPSTLGTHFASLCLFLFIKCVCEMPLTDSKNFTFVSTSFNTELHFYISLSVIFMRFDNGNSFTVAI